MNREEGKPAPVPAGDKQVGEDLWHRHGAERGVWSETMLIALERGIKGNRWFSLIDKVRSAETLGTAWGKVRHNAGACGVDRISVGFFGKDSGKRLLALKEQLTGNSYIPSAIRRVRIPKPGSADMEEGVETAPEKGSPQGGVISPPLANIHLDPLDWPNRYFGDLGLFSLEQARREQMSLRRGANR